MVKVGDICRTKGNNNYFYKITLVEGLHVRYDVSQYFTDTFQFKELPYLEWSNRGGCDVIIPWEIMNRDDIPSRILAGEFNV